MKSLAATLRARAAREDGRAWRLCFRQRRTVDQKLWRRPNAKSSTELALPGEANVDIGIIVTYCMKTVNLRALPTVVGNVRLVGALLDAAVVGMP
ncbi:MAG: hypothetical protein U5L03_05175 [Burkholderiaceae bacterium]|nr:hypothetical protein [Burkholderiaceae bacterium]